MCKIIYRIHSRKSEFCQKQPQEKNLSERSLFKRDSRKYQWGRDVSWGGKGSQ